MYLGMGQGVRWKVKAGKLTVNLLFCLLPRIEAEFSSMELWIGAILFSKVYQQQLVMWQQLQSHPEHGALRWLELAQNLRHILC